MSTEPARIDSRPASAPRFWALTRKTRKSIFSGLLTVGVRQVAEVISVQTNPDRQGGDVVMTWLRYFSRGRSILVESTSQRRRRGGLADSLAGWPGH